MENDKESGNNKSEQENNIKLKMSKKKKIMIRLLLLLIGIIAVSTIFIVYQIKSNIDTMIIPNTKVETEKEGEIVTIPVSNQEDNNNDFYLLIMGLDYRGEHDALLTDSLMVLHIIPQEANVKLLSIPRDLLVENTSGSTVKINSLFSEGYTLYKKKSEKEPSILTGDTIQLGSRMLDKAILSGAIANTRTKIEELLDVNIDNSVLVNFNTVISLVDEVGGIEIDVKRSMKYKATNLYLEPGLQVLKGEDALGYARFREDDRGTRYFASDFERGARQQEVVKALAEEIFSWKNSVKTLTLLKIVSENVQTDMDYSVMYSMIKKYYNVFNSDSFISIPFPEHYSQQGDVVISDDALYNLQNVFKSIEVEQQVQNEIIP